MALSWIERTGAARQCGVVALSILPFYLPNIPSISRPIAAFFTDSDLTILQLLVAFVGAMAIVGRARWPRNHRIAIELAAMAAAFDGHMVRAAVLGAFAPFLYTLAMTSSRRSIVSLSSFATVSLAINQLRLHEYLHVVLAFLSSVVVVSLLHQ